MRFKISGDLKYRYEGTVWDDLAQGKGVYTTPMELCRFAEIVTLNASKKAQC